MKFADLRSKFTRASIANVIQKKSTLNPVLCKNNINRARHVAITGRAGAKFIRAFPNWGGVCGCGGDLDVQVMTPYLSALG